MSAPDLRPLFFQRLLLRGEGSVPPSGQGGHGFAEVPAPRGFTLSSWGCQALTGGWGEGTGKEPANTRNSFHKGQLEKRCISASLGGQGPWTENV